MGDVGDYWREHKEYQNKQRRLTLYCPYPYCNFCTKSNYTLDRHIDKEHMEDRREEG